jgi:hypothetical protein
MQLQSRVLSASGKTILALDLMALCEAPANGLTETILEDSQCASKETMDEEGPLEESGLSRSLHHVAGESAVSPMFHLKYRYFSFSKTVGPCVCSGWNPQTHAGRMQERQETSSARPSMQDPHHTVHINAEIRYDLAGHTMHS